MLVLADVSHVVLRESQWLWSKDCVRLSKKLRLLNAHVVSRPICVTWLLFQKWLDPSSVYTTERLSTELKLRCVPEHHSSRGMRAYYPKSRLCVSTLIPSWSSVYGATQRAIMIFIFIYIFYIIVLNLVVILAWNGWSLPWWIGYYLQASCSRTSRYRCHERCSFHSFVSGWMAWLLS